MLLGHCAFAVAATTCTPARINGDHPLAAGSQGFGAYAVNPGSDLGFGGPEPDVISFEFYKLDLSDPDLGTFDLASAVNSNYATCEQCVLIGQDLVDGSPTKIFLHSTGILDVSGDAAPGVATDLSLIWTNLRLVEVTIDPQTFESTPVTNGGCYDVVPEVVYAGNFDPTGYDPAHCAAVANTLDIYWEEVDGSMPACVGIEHTNGNVQDALTGRFSMNGTSVSDNCLATDNYSFSVSPDKSVMTGTAAVYNVPMLMTLSGDHACYTGHWRAGGFDFIGTIWNFNAQ